MITRPLNLASKLRPEPRNFDFLFLVNGALIVLFFSLFGSRFVFAPGLGIDFQLPRVPGSVLGAAQTTHYVSVNRGGMLYAAGQGQVTLLQLREWLKDQARGTKHPILQVNADAGVELSVLAEIYTAAREANFQVLEAADVVRAAPGDPN
jgi:biopolymer transport protein ExbD